MSYSIDLERDELLCFTRDAAGRAARRINTDHWMSSRVLVSPALTGLPQGAPQWRLSVDRFDGSAWNADRAARVWHALVPLLADRSYLEIRAEQGERFRIRWEHRHVCQDEPVLTIWRRFSLLGPFEKLEVPPVLDR